jgi:hypothetical protein
MSQNITVKIIKERSLLVLEGKLSEGVLEKVFAHGYPAPHTISPDKPEEIPAWKGQVGYAILRDDDVKKIMKSVRERLAEYNSKVPETEKYNLISDLG